MPDIAPYELKSDLARWSMPSQRSQVDRRLAWANSTCLLFLLVGIIGARTRTPVPRVPPPLEEVAPIIIAAPPPPPPAETVKQEQPEPQKAPAPVAIVVPNAPSINFSIPTIGALVAPASLSEATVSSAIPGGSVSAPAAPTHVGFTGESGDRPSPQDYPPMAKQLHQQGNVVLDIVPDANGKILTVDVKSSSGSSILDRAARDFVMLHWRLPRDQPGHIFEISFDYVLK